MSKTLRHIWIDKTLYLVPRSSKDILMLINQVFQGTEDTNGLVTFDSKKYKITNIDIFERFLIHWLMSINSGNSEPILAGENELSVELQISQDLVPQKELKTFNHEKPQS